MESFAAAWHRCFGVDRGDGSDLLNAASSHYVFLLYVVRFGRARRNSRDHPPQRRPLRAGADPHATRSSWSLFNALRTVCSWRADHPLRRRHYGAVPFRNHAGEPGKIAERRAIQQDLAAWSTRSEEHTSELQSRGLISYA